MLVEDFFQYLATRSSLPFEARLYALVLWPRHAALRDLVRKQTLTGVPRLAWHGHSTNAIRY